jgi:hypothetical protein
MQSCNKIPSYFNQLTKHDNSADNAESPKIVANDGKAPPILSIGIPSNNTKNPIKIKHIKISSPRNSENSSPRLVNFPSHSSEDNSPPPSK